MAYKASETPRGGWGQFIANYFTSDVKFVNRAIGGRNSKSFVEDGRLDYVNNTFKNDFPDYCIAMKQVASENNVALIDLMTKSLNYYTSIGYDNTYKLFMVSSNGTDYTHFTTTGATQIARLAAEGVKENKLPIAKYLK